jgi:probable HAF family extracellular repeat protein
VSHRFTRRTQLAMMLSLAATPAVGRSVEAKTKKKTYVVVDLGVLPSGTYSIGNAISSNGIVAGMSITGSGSHAVKLKDLELFQLDKETDGSAANDVNANGQVVGFISSADTGGQRATLWQDSGTVDLGTLGGPFSIAHAISDNGEVVGEATVADGMATHAFLWKNNAITDLGTLGGDASIAMDINADGLVAGLSTSQPGQQPYGPGTKAILWGPNGLVDLGALGGDVAAAAGINAKGWVVGGATTENGIEYGGPGTHAFLWKDGTMIDLGAFDGADFSSANAVNANGEVVGFAGNPKLDNPDNAMTAAYWDASGKLYNLNDAIPDDNGWFLVTAISINDDGLITGLGVYDGHYHGFILQPKK